MATVQDITGALYPDSIRGQPITPLQGESLLPAFEGKKLRERKSPIYFEYAGGAAVRDGKWKLVTKHPSQ